MSKKPRKPRFKLTIPVSEALSELLLELISPNPFTGISVDSDTFALTVLSSWCLIMLNTHTGFEQGQKFTDGGHDSIFRQAAAFLKAKRTNKKQ